MFGDRAYALTAQAYLEDKSLQSLAVATFMKGFKDRYAAQEAMTFASPGSNQEAVRQVMHIHRSRHHLSQTYMWFVLYLRGELGTDRESTQTRGDAPHHHSCALNVTSY